jgi:rRNA maturation endonuclease Nob1
MGKKKVVTSKAVEQEEVAESIVTQDEVAVKSVAKKKGLSSFGAMLKAAGAKRKERKKLYGKEN